METELTNTLIDKEAPVKRSRRPLETHHFSTRQKAAFAYEHAWRRLPCAHKVMLVLTFLLILVGNTCKLVSAIALKHAVDTLSGLNPGSSVTWMLVAFGGLQ